MPPTVLVTGTFDILHPGHRGLLRYAKKLGTDLTVVIGRDATVKKVKGYVPFFSETERIHNMKALGIADRVLLGGIHDKLEVIEHVRPDILCLGFDQRAFTAGLRRELAHRGLPTRVVRARKYPAGKFRTGGLHAAGLVALHRVVPSIIIEPRYATKRNVLKRSLYQNKIILTQKTIADKLSQIQRRLQRRGLGLKVWDSYRPLSVQKQLWNFMPDERYIGRPSTGPFHTRAAAVDLTLVDNNGTQLEMPTGFDDFSRRAHRNYPRHTPAAQKHIRLLEAAMTREGFSPLPSEWWHYTAPRWKSYSVLDIAI